ncbi:tetratricopeptide repeat protein [Oculatella sp. LEGE 06141]|uniref:tetratricopeptide repeat protein n=1 Tax=Oculatella sp. LEGE 06141 TaxID=1828648 RepID=UPI00187DE442|nr:tetratricopeptide repeat protein [Oculatella sp. LEGE 06141]MBE9177428.1 tetratricopeptide repeat protein [Oculatella sp. LEGE 06141]
MIHDDPDERDEANTKAYEELLVSVEASEGKLSLLIAVSDNTELREQIIKRYEADLSPQCRPYRITLPRREPSLRLAIAQTVQADDYLRQGGNAVLTVTGAEKLYFFKLNEERSEQEIFFGYLQWTREGLREFPFPVVLWVTHPILDQLSYRAPDFWSWRNGVFRFVSQQHGIMPRPRLAFLASSASPQLAIPNSDDAPRLLPIPHGLDSSQFNDDYSGSIADLQSLIQSLEQQGTKIRLLGSMYARLGLAYMERLEQGNAQDYQQEHDAAIEAFTRAANIQRELRLEADLAESLNCLAGLYYSQGRYGKAEPLYLQVIELNKRVLDANDPDAATSLENLARLYDSLGHYAEAETFYLQALELKKRLLGADHPEVAAILNNLAFVYKSQGRYGEAELLYLEAIEINNRSSDEELADVVIILNNLAMVYTAQGRYNEAEALYEQALELSVPVLGAGHLYTLLVRENLESLHSETR